MDYDYYNYVNTEISSEMFYSLMKILHEKLPLAKNYYVMRKNFWENYRYAFSSQESSPVRIIAKPKLIKGMSLTNQNAWNFPESR